MPGPLEVVLILLVVPLAGLYLAPSIVAFSRRHPNAAAICILNILLGWSVIGWIGALIWSLSAVQASRTTAGAQGRPRPAPEGPPPPRPQPAPGGNFCSQCGKALEPEDNYCGGCGLKISR